MTTKKKTKKTKKFKVTVKDEATTAAPATTQASADASANASENAGTAVASVTLSSTTPKVGDKITATVEPANASNPTYTWKADGVVIDGATAATFTVTDAQLGKKLTCTVSAGGASATSAETAAVAAEDVSELVIEAKQTGSSTFELKSNVALTNDDAITVTRGTTEQKITKIFADGGKTVTLTTSTAITASSYVIKVVPKDTKLKEKSITVTGEKSALKEIKFESDKLVLINNAASAGTVVVNGYDQFGAKVAITASNTQFYATGATPAYDSDTGVLTLTQAGGAFPFTVGSTIAVTVVYQDGATVIQQQATLTVAATAYVKTLEFGELATTNKDLAGKKLTITRLADNSYYYPITKAQNQYDQNLTKTDLNNMVLGGTLIISPANNGYAYIDSFDTLKDGTLIAKIKKGTVATIPTTVPLSLTSVGGGTFTKELKIEDDPYIASLDVTIPQTYGAGKVEVSVTAKDQDGADYDFYNSIAVAAGDVTFGDMNHLTNQGSVLDATTGVFSILKDTTNKTVKIYYSYGTNPGTATSDSVSIKTATPTVSTLKVTANPGGTLEKVSGIASGVKTSLKSGESIKLGDDYENNVVFLDNYGATTSIAAGTFSNAAVEDGTTALTTGNFTYTVALDGNIITDANGTVAWTGARAGKTLDLTISLYKGVSGKAKFVNSVDVKISFAASSTTYTATLTSSGNLLYVDSASTDTATLEVVRDVNGAKTTFTPWNSAAGPAIGATEYTLTDDLGLITAANTIDAQKAGNLADGTTGKDNIYVKDANGDIIASVVLDYSNAASTAKEVSWTFNSGKQAADDAVTTSLASAATFNGTEFVAGGYVLKIVDQYGLDVTNSSLTINGDSIPATTNTTAIANAWKNGGQTNTVVIKSGDVNKTVKITDNHA